MKRASFALLAVALTGCFDYAPVQEVAPAPGTEVRAHLTPAAAQQYVNRFGPQVQYLNGRLLRLEDRELSMTVDWVTTAQQTFSYREPGGDGTLTVPREQFDLIEAKQLHLGKSVVLGVAIAGGFYLLNQGRRAIWPSEETEGQCKALPCENPTKSIGVRLPIRIP